MSECERTHPKGEASVTSDVLAAVAKPLLRAESPEEPAQDAGDQIMRSRG